MTRFRIFAAIGLLLCSAHAQAQGFQMPAGTSTIAGKVVAADTGKPIRGAIVEIVIFGNLAGRFRSVTTDAEGKYEFKDLPKNTYQLAASGTRHLRMYFGAREAGATGMNNPARTIDLADGQRFDTADFSLLPYCAIEGTVVDEFGDPVPNVVIQVSQIAFGGGRKRLIPTGGTSGAPVKPTDDNGRFRVGGLAPGEYFVEALSGGFADPSAAGGFNITFYPGTTKTAAAQAVKLEPGRDQLNVSFALVPAAMTTVTGTLVDAQNRPLPGGNMMLMPSETAGTPLVMQSRAAANDKGAFTFRNVPPGTYTIQAFDGQVGTGGNLGAMAFGYLTFVVDGKPLEPLTVRVPAPRTLRGHISFEDDTTTLPRVSDVAVTVRPVNFESAPMAGGPPPTTINPDWTFEVKAMSGLRLVSAVSRTGWIVKRITAAGQDVTDAPVDLRERDVNDVEIVMTLRTTTLSGTVTDTDDKPLADYNVVVFPMDETKWGVWSRYVVLLRSDSRGGFTTKGLPAGAYVAVAMQNLAAGQWQDPEFLDAQRASGAGARFTMIDAESKSVTIKIRK